MRVMVSDKGGRSVVIKTELDQATTARHLSEGTVYEKVVKVSFQATTENINACWKEVARRSHFSLTVRKYRSYTP